MNEHGAFQMLGGDADLKPGAHVCFVYGTEAEHRALLTTYLFDGLQRKERVVYLVEAHTPAVVVDYLRDKTNVGTYLASGQLEILDARSVYLRSRSFSPEGTIEFLQRETARAITDGYTALRCTGEMTWALHGAPGSERLVEYESNLHDVFADPACRLIGLCQYDRRQFAADLLTSILRTHSTVIAAP